jgi:multisubunit Na+/H+ antiporter MnhB subunit
MIKKSKNLLLKRLMQVVFYIAVVSSSAILFYWPDLLFISVVVLSAGIIVFGLLTIIVPSLFWNIIVVMLFWSLLYLLGIGDCTNWQEAFRYVSSPKNLLPITIAISIHLFFQTSFFLATRGKGNGVRNL